MEVRLRIWPILYSSCSISNICIFRVTWEEMIFFRPNGITTFFCGKLLELEFQNSSNSCCLEILNVVQPLHPTVVTVNNVLQLTFIFHIQASECWLTGRKDINLKYSEITGTDQQIPLRELLIVHLDVSAMIRIILPSVWKVTCDSIFVGTLTLCHVQLLLLDF